MPTVVPGVPSVNGTFSTSAAVTSLRMCCGRITLAMSVIWTRKIEFGAPRVILTVLSSGAAMPASTPSGVALDVRGALDLAPDRLEALVGGRVLGEPGGAVDHVLGRERRPVMPLDAGMQVEGVRRGVRPTHPTCPRGRRDRRRIVVDGDEGVEDAVPPLELVARLELRPGGRSCTSRQVGRRAACRHRRAPGGALWPIRRAVIRRRSMRSRVASPPAYCCTRPR